MVRLVKGNVFKILKIPSNAGYNSLYDIFLDLEKQKETPHHKCFDKI
jgi:hypothetical protein